MIRATLMMTEHTAANDQGMILIVDDTPRNIQLLGNILSKEGYRIAVATSGNKALESVAREKPDLILLDIMMPDMDGFQVCERLKADEATAGIPIIFLSAKTSTEDKLHGFKLGAADYITKPFEVAEVLARARTHLRLKLALEEIHRYNTQLEEMLAARTRELIHSERQAAIGMLIQGIVHNMNGPIGAIGLLSDNIRLTQQSVAKLLHDDSADEAAQVHKAMDDVRESSELIHAAQQKLAHMVHSMLVKSRADKSSDMEVLDLNGIVERELDFLDADMAFKHEVRKEIDLDPRPLPVEVVPGEIGQLFQNLVRNALDALTGQSDACLTVRTGQEQERVWLAVADNGPGIPDGIVSQIFDPFFTTKAKMTDEPHDEPVGTGLGLYYCQDLVRSYQGAIAVDTAAGAGATFTVYLPRAGESG